ncbi:MAG: AAA family ATPase [Oligoflexales bacterium]|nr:AAA family ATPase [Oligoflexales bacterium]
MPFKKKAVRISQKAARKPKVFASSIATSSAAKPLDAALVYMKCNDKDFDLPKRQSAKKSHEIIAQDRAVQAINLGLGIRKPGYNIYVAGSAGTGKLSVITNFLEAWSKGAPSPFDWVYVHDFQDPETPKAIKLKAGEGRVFKKRMDQLNKSLRDQITKVLHSEEYENPANLFLSTSNDKKSKLFSKLENKAKTMGFTIKSTRVGIETIPVVHGRALTEKEYNKLDNQQKAEIEKQRSQLEPSILDFARKIREIEIKSTSYIEDLRKELGKKVVNSQLTLMFDYYAKNEEIKNYLEEVSKDIIDNLLEFVEEESDDGQASEESLRHNIEIKDRFVKYKVNLFVDNTGKSNAPIVIETNPTYYNLFGRIEKNVEYGMYRTDFTMLKSGAVQRANGGYLVLNASDIFRGGADSIWEFLKRVLKNQKAFIEDMGEQYSLLPTSGLRPQPIPLDLKVIIIGSDDIYHILYDEDEDFRKIFKIKADFNYKMPRTKLNMNSYADFIINRALVEGLLPVQKSAVCSIIEYGSRLVEDHNYLSTQFGTIKDLLIEADFIARHTKQKQITRQHVELALENQIHRVDLVEEQLMDSIKSKDYLVSVDGERVGQVNGLSVYDFGDHVFGRVGRITCTTSMNEEGILNVERASKLSGNIHDKGVYILSGFLSALLARESSLGFSASVCFEQSYGIIDGDSATIAELIAVISSISGIPVKQNFAVTGSLNQLGDVQPVGGINEKIEGFLKTCKLLGENKSYGVVIPHQNVDNLMLHKFVRDAIGEGFLKIYPVAHFFQAFEITTGVEFGAKNIYVKNFEDKSALQIISKKLHKIHESRKNLYLHTGGLPQPLDKKSSARRKKWP